MTVDRSRAPEPSAPRPYRFPEVARRTLPNGLRLLVVENHNAPIASIRAVITSGADRDSAEKAGLASLTSDLLDEGAGSRDAMELAEAVGRLGGALATGSDWDATYASIDVLSRNAREAISILADVVCRPLLPADGMERVRSERLMDILQQREEPGAIAGKRFANLLYGKGTYGNSVSGTRESVTALTLDDVRSFYSAHYIPNNAAIVVGGDVDSSEILDILEAEFRDWQRGETPPSPSVLPQAFDASMIYLVDRPTAVQSEIRIGHVGVPRSSEDYFPLSVMNALLGGVFNSRINLNLRERHGYTYGARSAFAFRKQPGPFVVSAPVRNEVTRESVSEVLAELRRIRTGDIEDGELNDTRNYMMGVFPATVQTSSDLASRLVDMELYSLPSDYFDRYRERIGAIGKDDIARVAKRYIDPDRVLIVIVGNAAQVREPLATLGFPIHHVDVDGNALPIA